MPRDFRLEQDLYDVAVEFEALGRRASRAALNDNLLQGDLRVLFALLTSKRSQAELSRTVAMDTGQMARTVARLRRKGLVEDDGSAKGRARTLRLSELGGQFANEARDRQLSVIRDYLEDPADAQVVRLAAVCNVVANRLYEDRPTRPFVREAKSGEGGILQHLAVKTLSSSLFGLNPDQIEKYATDAFSEYCRARDTGFGFFLVAESWGMVAGGIVVVGDPAISSASASLFVIDRTFLGKGLGSELLIQTLMRLRQANYERLTITAPRDKEGGSFFAANGWSRTAVRPSHSLRSSTVLEEWSLRLK